MMLYMYIYVWMGYCLRYMYVDICFFVFGRLFGSTRSMYLYRLCSGGIYVYMYDLCTIEVALLHDLCLDSLFAGILYGFECKCADMRKTFINLAVVSCTSTLESNNYAWDSEILVDCGAAWCS